MALRWFLALTLLSSLFLPVTAAKAQTLDQYGGYASLSVPGGATGFFRVAKIGNRWVFATPDGNAFWMRAVYSATESGLESTVIPNKYSGDVNLWATQRNRRLLSWGFNALGEYTSARGLPVGIWGGQPNDVKLPFILILNAAMDAMDNPKNIGLPEPVKDVIKGVPTAAYNDYRGPLVDVYDPKFRQAYQAEITYWNSAITGGFANKPWIIGITPDDADKLYGFKSRGDAPVVGYPHPAYMVATTKFQYTSAEHPSGGTWLDPKLYSKYAWIDVLKAKYNNDISALNAAWGTGGFYTSFDSAGGYGVGRGVIDEDGRHTAWMGTNAKMLTGATSAVKADLDAFLYEFGKQWTITAVSTIRAADSNHLIFGPAALNNYGAKARDQILKALTDNGIDVFQLNYDPVYGPMAGSMSENNQTYDLTGKPAFIWYSVTAQADSGMYASPVPYAAPNFATQVQRGSHYANVDIPSFLNAQGASGDYYVIGFDWWELIDNPSEQTNWGLISRKDNAYDGKEAVMATGTDPWGFRTGGEDRNYGNFLSYVTTANATVAAALGAGSGGGSTAGGTTTNALSVAITAPTSGSTVQQSVTVTATASSSAVRVNLLLDGSIMAIVSGTTAAYPWDTTTTPNGIHQWVAKAYDTSGTVVTSSPDAVSVQNQTTGDTTAPIVAISQPASGATVSRHSMVTIAATASDNVGVTRVEFYVSGSLKCAVAAAQYNCAWKVPAAGSKTYSLQAKAYDATGNVGSSAIVKVTAK
jgi:hypothetical protein